MRLAGKAQVSVVVAILLVVLGSPPVFAQGYVIRAGDIVDISVLGEPAVSGMAAVDSDGKITLQMAGTIPAAGLTLAQLTQKVTEALKPFVRDPQVTVTMRSSRRLYAYVLGQVSRPGAYEIDRGSMVTQVVAMAGGPASGAALDRSFVVRSDKSIPVDLQALLVAGNPSADVALEPGDVVVVPQKTNRVLVMGAVQKPGTYPFTPGDRVVDILSAAGGPAQNASTNDIGVIRQRGGQKAAVTHINLSKFYKDGDVTQNVVLQTDDIVYVPEQAKGFDWGTILNPLSILVLLFK